MSFLRGVSLCICSVILASKGLVGNTPAQESMGTPDFMARMNLSMTQMDRSMKDAPMNGNVDHDFATMMIPHHEGAIEMAKAELSFGQDPVMRRLAQEILVDQKSEIDAMNLWLRKQPKAPNKENTK